MSKIIAVLMIGLLASEPVFANYRNAVAYQARRDYVSAAGAFFQAYGYPKASGERRKAEWGLAQSLKQLGLYYSASKYLSAIVRRGSKGNNRFFNDALRELGVINSTVNLGQSHIVQLFKAKIDSAYVPGAARGFYFFYLGIEAFTKRKFEKAQSFFKKVPSASPYYVRALFHLGVISNLRGSHSQAISYFESVKSGASKGEKGLWIREQANLNIARVHYETKNYRKSIQYYAQIPRESDNWLQALFEASWAFFLMQKHNNTLGTIHTLHSPFFINTFFPETYILQAITFLRLCRFNQVKSSMARFKARYQDVFKELKSMLNTFERNPKGFYKLVYDYRVGSLNRYRKVAAILDSLSKTDYFKEAYRTLRFSDNELNQLDRFSSRWGQTGLLDELKEFLRNKKSLAIKDAGRRLYNEAAGYYAYLMELSNQTRLINTEMVLGRVDRFRAKLNVGQADKKTNFIGGLEELKVAQDLEYWPFEGEYWQDELGGYVYNIESICGKGKGKK